MRGASGGQVADGIPGQHVLSETEATRLHAKAWLFRRNSGYDTAFVGSSNLSRSALVDGLEWNVRLSGVGTPDLVRKFAATFDTYWESSAFVPYDPARDGDRLDDALASAGNRTGKRTSISLAGLEVRPLPHQQEILEALDTEREVHERHRNLVVAATGTGKTVVAALDYRRKTGIADANGTRHLIGAYVSLDPKNWDHLRQATYIFGAVGIGFSFPNSGWAQFHAGQPWDVVPNDGGNDGGHYVPVLGAPTADKVGVVTWGKRQEMTRPFYEKYNDEAWVYITLEELNSSGAGLHGFDINTLNSFLSALHN